MTNGDPRTHEFTTSQRYRVNRLNVVAIIIEKYTCKTDADDKVKKKLSSRRTYENGPSVPGRWLSVKNKRRNRRRPDGPPPDDPLKFDHWSDWR